MNLYASVGHIRNRILILWCGLVGLLAIAQYSARPISTGRQLRNQIAIGGEWRLVPLLVLGLLGILLICLTQYLLQRQYALIMQRVAKWSEVVSNQRSEQNLPRLRDLNVKRFDLQSLRAVQDKLESAINLLQFRYDHLLEDRSRTTDALNGMQEGLVAVDSDLELLLVNSAGRDLLEMPGHLRIGQPLVELVRQPSILALIRKTHVGGKAVEAIEKVGGSRGRWLRLRVSPLTDLHRDVDSSQPHAVLLLISDVTRLTKLESMRRDFTTNVSHELKTPLAAIQAYAETLLIGAIDDPDANRRFVQGIATQADRLSALIHDLLQLAKLDAQPDNIALAPIEIVEVLHDVIAQQSPLANARRIKLIFDEPATDPLVRANAEAIRVVASNLVSNAIRYNREGGHVWVSLKLRRDDAVLQVRDDGVGIDPEEHSRIFERFYRVDKARSIDTGGTGLGLAIVKHLTQQMGGQISLRSQPSLGTTFEVVLKRSI